MNYNEAKRYKNNIFVLAGLKSTGPGKGHKCIQIRISYFSYFVFFRYPLLIYFYYHLRKAVLFITTTSSPTTYHQTLSFPSPISLTLLIKSSRFFHDITCTYIYTLKGKEKLLKIRRGIF